jgi:hypothetical protein
LFNGQTQFEIEAMIVMSDNGFLSNLMVRNIYNNTEAQTMVITIRKNLQITALSVSIPANQSIANNTTSIVPFNKGDFISVLFTGGPNINNSGMITFTINT